MASPLQARSNVTLIVEINRKIITLTVHSFHFGLKIFCKMCPLSHCQKWLSFSVSV